MGKLLHFHWPDLCSFGSGGHYNLQVMWKQMDREIPKGKTDLYILGAAYKWHPYAARTLPVTSPWLCADVRTCLCLTCWAENTKEGGNLWRCRVEAGFCWNIGLKLNQQGTMMDVHKLVLFLIESATDSFSFVCAKMIIWPRFTVQLPVAADAWIMEGNSFRPYWTTFPLWSDVNSEKLQSWSASFPSPQVI